jgi:hypothetical protein
MAESLSGRPYLTCAEAATYCGFKTIGGIQQAVRRGKLKPAGRRGGTGTYVFAREDLDAFLTGGLQPHERLFVPPEWTEAAAQGALIDVTARPTRRRGPAAPLLSPVAGPGHVQGSSLDRDRAPREMPIHGAATRSKPLPRVRDARENGNGNHGDGDGEPEKTAGKSAAEKGSPAKGAAAKSAAAKSAAAKSGMKERGRARADVAADPVARIVAALSGPTKKGEQKQASADLTAASGKKQAKLSSREKSQSR